MIIMQVSEELSNHPLWAGSSLGLDFRYKMLTKDRMRAKIDQYQKCDDLTPRERVFLELLRHEVEKN
jgi:hypothetical protein